MGGLHFSTPYYYGDKSIIGGEDSVYAVVAHEGNVIFASFVKSIVLATLYAQENIQERDSTEIPCVSIFGKKLRWALKKASLFSESYAKICIRNFGNHASGACRN